MACLGFLVECIFGGGEEVWSGGAEPAIHAWWTMWDFILPSARYGWEDGLV